MNLELSSSSPTWTVSIRVTGSRKPEYRIATPKDVLPFLKQLPGVLEARFGERFKVPIAAVMADFPLEVFADIAFEGCLGYLAGDIPRGTYYLPAARSGFLQSHRALASFVMNRAPLVGIETLAIPKMTGVIGDFIGLLLGLQGRKPGEYATLADSLERDVMSGTVKVRPGPSGYPEMSYQMGNSEVPLHRTSSMVSELAPIALYLKHILKAKDLLIIEEPESHLHPQSQLQLAKVLVILVNSGVDVMITTHSDYFLRQLNNAIKRWDIATQTEDQIPKDALNPRDVSAVLFRRSLAGVTRTTALRVDRRAGISELEFGRVAEQLYRKSVTLDSEHLYLEALES